MQLDMVKLPVSNRRHKQTIVRTSSFGPMKKRGMVKYDNGLIKMPNQILIYMGLVVYTTLKILFHFVMYLCEVWLNPVFSTIGSTVMYMYVCTFYEWKESYILNFANYG